MLVGNREDQVEGDAHRCRRVWSGEAKRRIVAETRDPGSSVAIVGRRHDLTANLLLTWRRQVGAASAGDGDATRLVPAMITPDPAPAVLPAPAAPTGRIEIALAGGDRVIVDA